MVQLAWSVFSVLVLIGVIYTWKYIEDNKAYSLQKFTCEYERIQWLRKHGYVGQDGQPIKCPYCGGYHFEERDKYCEEVWGSMYPVEYDVVCTGCGKGVCHFAYGAYIDY